MPQLQEQKLIDLQVIPTLDRTTRTNAFSPTIGHKIKNQNLLSPQTRKYPQSVVGMRSAFEEIQSNQLLQQQQVDITQLFSSNLDKTNGNISAPSSQSKVVQRIHSNSAQRNRKVPTNKFRIREISAQKLREQKNEKYISKIIINDNDIQQIILQNLNSSKSGRGAVYGSNPIKNNQSPVQSPRSKRTREAARLLDL